MISPQQKYHFFFQFLIIEVTKILLKIENAIFHSLYLYLSVYLFISVALKKIFHKNSEHVFLSL